MADRTIAGTRIRDIAERSGMSLGHLQYYFPTKGELYLAVLDHMRATFVEDRNRAFSESPTNPGSRLKVFLEQQMRLMRSQLDLLKVRLDFATSGATDAVINQKNRDMYESWRRDIEVVVSEGVTAGEFNPASAPVVPDLLIAVMEGAVLKYIADPDGIDLDEFFDAAHQMAMALLTDHRPPRDNR